MVAHDTGITSDMLASVVERTVQKAFSEALSKSQKSFATMSSDSSSSDDDDDDESILSRNSKPKFTLKNTRSRSSADMSSLGLGLKNSRNSRQSRSSKSLLSIGEDANPVHRNTSELSLMSGLSRDSSGEVKKKKKKKKKSKEKKSKKNSSGSSVRSSRRKAKKDEEWVAAGIPIDMLAQHGRSSYIQPSTLATDDYAHDLCDIVPHTHQSEQGIVVKKKKKKKFKEDGVDQQQQQQLVLMGSQALVSVNNERQQEHAPNQTTARQKFDARLAWTFEGAPQKNYDFESVVHSHFPGAVTNQELVTTVVSTLFKKGYKVGNTLLATSLCCDELARQLEEDFNGVYGNNFNLGGLAGFPFAGNTGFGAMSHHIPDDGYCLIVFGPHVGVAKDGSVGKVERAGIELIDTCCGSAVAASNYVDEITTGSKLPTVQIQKFTDFQQSAVQELILPHGKRLADAGSERMIELPYAIYDSQDMLLSEIIKVGSEGLKRGLALLGGIQINTGPDTPDYFHPLRFDYMNYRGEIVDNMLESLTTK